MWDTTKEWLSQPYSEEMDAFHWFLFLGLLTAIVIAWNIILYHLFDRG